MTAEIALLNRRALAFAADSAVTITGGINDKIYNSAEKIFELSRCVPIGLMLYNNMEFVGVPIDVITRKFRSEQDAEFASCKDACDRYLEYLCGFKRSKDDETPHLAGILSPEMQEIRRKHANDLPALYNKAIGENKFDPESISCGFLVEILTEHESIHKKHPLDGFLSDIPLEQFVVEYGEFVLNLFRGLVHSGRNEAVEKKALEWAFATLKSEIFSDSRTGLVFGGFGTEDLFPSLHSIEMDGIFFGQIKKRVTQDIDIDRRGEKAAIVPFAQTEMVERFLFGIDSDLEETVLEFVRKSSDLVLAKVKSASGQDLSSMGLDGASYSSNIRNLLDRLKMRSRDETLDMVDFMPKQELAYAAESFVSLTSVKRKVSSQQETVGGPIDVAVITKNEGFVWIKRKHYFDRELNPSYSVRSVQSH